MLNGDSPQGLMLSTTALFTNLLDEGGLLLFFKKTTLFCVGVLHTSKQCCDSFSDQQRD